MSVVLKFPNKLKTISVTITWNQKCLANMEAIVESCHFSNIFTKSSLVCKHKRQSLCCVEFESIVWNWNSYLHQHYKNNIRFDSLQHVSDVSRIFLPFEFVIDLNFSLLLSKFDNASRRSLRVIHKSPYWRRKEVR